jgi:hypothetical protein
MHRNGWDALREVSRVRCRLVVTWNKLLAERNAFVPVPIIAKKDIRQLLGGAGRWEEAIGDGGFDFGQRLVYLWVVLAGTSGTATVGHGADSDAPTCGTIRVAHGRPTCRSILAADRESAFSWIILQCRIRAPRGPAEILAIAADPAFEIPPPF